MNYIGDFKESFTEIKIGSKALPLLTSFFTNIAQCSTRSTPQLDLCLGIGDLSEAWHYLNIERQTASIVLELR